MIPLTLVISRRGNASALRVATAPRPRSTVYSGAALVAAAVLFLVLGALIGAGLAHVSIAPSSERSMSGRRINPVISSASHHGSVRSSVAGSARQARRALESRDRQGKPVSDALRAQVDADRARRDIDSWINGGEPFPNGGDPRRTS